MSRMINIRHGENDEYTITCSMTRAYPATGECGYSLGSPAEPSEIEDLCVELEIYDDIGEGIYDITKLLSEKQLSRVEDIIWKHIERISHD